MNIYSISEFEQKVPTILDLAIEDGKVLIKKDEETIFVIMPYITKSSPFDIKGIHSDITTEEIISFIRESRKA
jgi:hypothetical protein